MIGYFGAKTQLAGQIVELLPPHASYVEPFAGSMAVLMAKPRAERIEVANDIDQDLMIFWKVLREKPEELTRVCALTPHSRAEYAAAWPIPPGTSGLERARRVWVKLTQGRGGQLRPTGWRYHRSPRGRGSTMPSIISGYIERFGFAAERLAGVSLECLPALEVITKYGGDPETLLYVDPPYLGNTRMRAPTSTKWNTKTSTTTSPRRFGLLRQPWWSPATPRHSTRGSTGGGHAPNCTRSPGKAAVAETTVSAPRCSGPTESSHSPTTRPAPHSGCGCYWAVDPYLAGMSTHHQHQPTRVRFDTIGPGWMIATIDGITLACTPVSSSEVDTVTGELAEILGGRIKVEVCDQQGQITRTRTVSETDSAQKRANQRNRPTDGGLRPAHRGPVSGGGLVVALMALVTALLLLVHALTGPD